MRCTQSNNNILEICNTHSAEEKNLLHFHFFCILYILKNFISIVTNIKKQRNETKKCQDKEEMSGNDKSAHNFLRVAYFLISLLH